ncbi:uncharacterized protein J8A68_005668 [[Candida] subhashii]|uniref:non-specific serine/threonine protein kinase n=1 Tax=[Candida] subhashii TaxID=561895 RepID=A0A8J5QGP1_9ASCO|nr:uncharacterized protein J8A68_005668 [[Candida] subhashii]KAG7660851.1 hypothetical protein J8A68_005668 [[Candida] subhashii]
MGEIRSPTELEIYEEVGRGGFGTVYRGLIKSTNQEIAIKQIDLENNDINDLQEINTEIQIISECKTCPQITQYLGSFVKNYKLWVVMEFMNGGSLFEILKAGRIDDESVISILVYEILCALEYLHNQGKIHRDLKSQNILLNKEGQVKLTDFGVSAQLSSNFSRRNTTVGTPYWMAPEMIVNNKGGHSFKADIWSLGCCAYEAYTGKPPLQNKYPPMKALRMISQCQRVGDFVGLIELGELDISKEFSDFLSVCFVENPRERYSASKLLQHKFITKYQGSVGDKTKAIKKLITKKQLWNQDNHMVKTQRYYIPTELHKNQMKWNLSDTEEGAGQQAKKTIHFDISSIKSTSTESPTKEPTGSPEPFPVQLHPTAMLNSPPSTPKLTPKQDQLFQSLKPEFHRILSKVFTKLDTRANLTTEQYDLLVSLNDNAMKLLTFIQSDDESTNRKVIIFQFLKYFLKELTKDNNQDSSQRSILQKLIIPSHFTVGKVSNTMVLRHKASASSYSGTSPTGTVFNEFDEIENSLLNSWIDRMSDK